MYSHVKDDRKEQELITVPAAESQQVSPKCFCAEAMQRMQAAQSNQRSHFAHESVQAS
jgi:hypothetical protein